MARNWERRLATSVGVKPAERRRSNPWGGEGCGGACCAVPMVLKPLRDDALLISTSSSAGVRCVFVEMEQ